MKILEKLEADMRAIEADHQKRLRKIDSQYRLLVACLVITAVLYVFVPWERLWAK